VPLQETNQDGDQDIHQFQLLLLDQLTLNNHPLMELLLELILPLMVIPNPSSLTLSVKLPQLVMFHLIQYSLLVLLQETNQDGDLDIQLFQPLLFHQLTGLNHPLLDLLPDHLLSPMEIPNHSMLILSDKLPQQVTFHLTQYLLLVPLQETNQDGDQDIQEFQPLLFHQPTGLSHPLLVLPPDHLP
jgi:hypothetical protein